MRIFIDDDEFYIPEQEELGRGEILDRVRQKVSEKGRLISDILVDGESLSEDDFQVIPSEVDVRFYSATMADVKKEALDKADEVVSELQMVLDKISCKIKLGLFDDMEELLERVSKNVEWVLNVYYNYRILMPRETELSCDMDIEETYETLSGSFIRLDEFLAKERISECVGILEEIVSLIDEISVYGRCLANSLEENG